MTYLAIKNNFPVKAAATVGGITDMELFVKDFPAAEDLFRQLYKDYDEKRTQILGSRSVIKWVELINTPLLLMNGQADPQVRPYHVLNLAKKLSEQGKVFQLVILVEGNHILSGKKH